MINSKIILCQGINLDKDQVNVLSYSENEMVALCEDKAIARDLHYSFIDEAKQIIYCSFPYDTCLKANYIAFQNPNYSNKWFFAFVENVVYKGDRNTEIHFKVDSWSTWFSYITPKTSFVVREHTNDDSVGANIIEEGLDTGTPIVVGSIVEHGFSTFGYIALDTNYLPDTETISGISVKNGIIRGCQTVVFGYNNYGSIDLFKFLLKAEIDGKADSILNLYYIPYEVITVADLVQHQFRVESISDPDGVYYTFPDSFDVYSSTYNFTGNFTWADYTPRNAKCKTYPYNYLLVSNNNGSFLTYRYEDFSGMPNFSFKFEYASTVGGSGRVVPLSYKGYTRCDDESIPLSKTPTFAWSSDSYINWLTQNAIDIPIQLGSSVLGGVGGLLQPANAKGMGGGLSPLSLLGSFTSLSSTLLSTMAADYKAQLLPPAQHGGSSGDVVFASKRNTISFIPMRCDLQHIRQIDDYFTRFGYKTNRLKVPNVTGRRNFNYIEISPSDEFGIGNVPNKFMEEINGLARRGLTIWHNHENVGNYLVQNDIV